MVSIVTWKAGYVMETKLTNIASFAKIIFSIGAYIGHAKLMLEGTKYISFINMTFFYRLDPSRGYISIVKTLNSKFKR
jgi:hypothetical protein